MRRVLRQRLVPLCLAALGASGCVTTAPARVGGLESPHREPELVTVTHRVEKGQTLYRIAKTYGVGVDALMAANGIDDARALQVGDLLVIPGATGARAVEAAPDSPEPSPTRALTEAELREKRPKAVQVGRPQGTLDWPLRGVLYARFGRKGKEAHDGIDLAAPAGTPVRTAGAGAVLYAGEQKGYGLIVIVEHGSGLITLYAHNRDLRVKTGQQVRQGQVVATVGDSGRTSGPHLHFEVREKGVPVDPLLHLGPVPGAP